MKDWQRAHLVRVATGEPVRVPAFSLTGPEVQVWVDDWTREDVVARSAGQCVVCYRWTWLAGDPRGSVGDATCEYLQAVDYGMTGPDVARCAACANTADRCAKAERLAMTEFWEAAQ